MRRARSRRISAPTARARASSFVSSRRPTARGSASPRRRKRSKKGRWVRSLLRHAARREGTDELDAYRALVLDVANAVAGAKGGVQPEETAAIDEDHGRARGRVAPDRAEAAVPERDERPTTGPVTEAASTFDDRQRERPPGRSGGTSSHVNALPRRRASSPGVRVGRPRREGAARPRRASSSPCARRRASHRRALRPRTPGRVRSRVRATASRPRRTWRSGNPRPAARQRPRRAQHEGRPRQ